MSRHPNPPDDVATRPAAFGAAVAAHLPFLRRLVSRLERNAQDRDDVVQETVENALSRWTSYRTDMPFVGWLAWRMRHVVSKRRARRALSTTALGEHAVPAAQHEYVEAADLARTIDDLPYGYGAVIKRVILGGEYTGKGGARAMRAQAQRAREALAERLREAA